jgi:hypothetical protein
VTNTRTGESGRTISLGSGIRRAPLDRPVTVEPGDTYEITNSGTAYRAEADMFIQGVFGVGGGAYPFTTEGYGPDRAELFALPHPFYGAQAAGAPPPGPSRGVADVERTTIILRASVRSPRRLVRASRSRRKVRRLRARGAVLGAEARRARRVAVQVRRYGRWDVVDRGRVRAGGRFSLRGRVVLAARTKRVRLRALVAGVGRSPVVRVRVR